MKIIIFFILMACLKFSYAENRATFANSIDSLNALGMNDEWINKTTNLQRSMIMRSTAYVSVEKFREYLKTSYVPWTESQKNRWSKSLNILSPKLKEFCIDLPDNFQIIQTNGKDSDNAAYTRSNSIFLPNEINQTFAEDQLLIAHELFHIISRINPVLRENLYKLIGFKKSKELIFPTEWLNIRVANPDAYNNNYYMEIINEKKNIKIMPILVAVKNDTSKNLFNMMQTRLLVVDSKMEGMTPSRVNNEIVWDLKENSSEYNKNLGGNTNYTIHPEEVMADNFSFLLVNEKVPNTQLIEKIKEVLLNNCKNSKISN